MTLAPHPLPVFSAAFCLSMQQSHTLNKVQYLADRDVSSHLFSRNDSPLICTTTSASTVSKSMWGRFRYLCACLTPRTIYKPQFKQMTFKWQCPVGSLIIILSWFLLKLSNSPALLAEGFLRKPLAWLCPWMNWQQLPCFLLVQLLITHLATFADMSRIGSCPVSGCEEPSIRPMYGEIVSLTFHELVFSKFFLILYL